MKPLPPALWLALCLLLSPALAGAEQMRRLGGYEVHYSVFPSLFLRAETAKRYGLRRGPGLSILNISVLGTGGKGTVCAIKGKARNLLEQSHPLEFQEVREQEAVYYLAEVRHADQEVLRFSLDITPNGASTLNFAFQQRLHADD